MPQAPARQDNAIKPAQAAPQIRFSGNGRVWQTETQKANVGVPTKIAHSVATVATHIGHHGMNHHSSSSWSVTSVVITSTFLLYSLSLFSKYYAIILNCATIDFRLLQQLSNPTNCCLRLRFIRLSSLYIGVGCEGLGWFKVLASLTVISIVPC